MDGVGNRLVENAFFVLGLKPGCSRIEVEREGQKLLGQMDLGLAQAAEYATPLGLRPRTAELIRWAMAELRDPSRRLRHETWADVKTTEMPPPSPSTQIELEPWADARALMGWRR